jgi:hypothetical protein
MHVSLSAAWADERILFTLFLEILHTIEGCPLNTDVLDPKTEASKHETAIFSKTAAKIFNEFQQLMETTLLNEAAYMVSSRKGRCPF